MPLDHVSFDIPFVFVIPLLYHIDRKVDELLIHYPVYLPVVDYYILSKNIRI